MSETLVIYFSHTGSNKLVAEKIKENLKSDILEIVEKKTPGKLSDTISVFKTLLKIPANLEEIEVDISKYEKVVLLAPIWIGNMPAALRTFVSKYGEKIKKIYLFSVSGSGKNEKMIAEIEEMMGKKISVVGRVSLATGYEAGDEMPKMSKKDFEKEDVQNLIKDFSKQVKSGEKKWDEIVDLNKDTKKKKSKKCDKSEDKVGNIFGEVIGFGISYLLLIKVDDWWDFITENYKMWLVIALRLLIINFIVKIIKNLVSDKGLKSFFKVISSGIDMVSMYYFIKFMPFDFNRIVNVEMDLNNVMIIAFQIVMVILGLAVIGGLIGMIFNGKERCQE